MGKKIFVSYKYADSNVRVIDGQNPTTVRDYVDILQSKIDESDHIYKGEDDGEDLSSLADSTIGSKLGDKIFDSTVTIVFLSKEMKDITPENDQWIPWEISYSLRVQSREGKKSKTNAILGVVLPDQFNSYEWYYTYNLGCNSVTHQTNQLFEILQDNMFNIKSPKVRTCNGTTIYEGECSYIKTVKWDDFIENIDLFIGIAVEICESQDLYTIRKTV